ncbi:hypothetical protein K438DRAFT_2121807 [Mycena galopus ATCC 62051]|nr:hypothetical protein K438DRAFT_2121807 [Mycena galopus ATCC 62051]
MALTIPFSTRVWEMQMEIERATARQTIPVFRRTLRHSDCDQEQSALEASFSPIGPFPPALPHLQTILIFDGGLNPSLTVEHPSKNDTGWIIAKEKVGASIAREDKSAYEEREKPGMSAHHFETESYSSLSITPPPSLSYSSMSTESSSGDWTIQMETLMDNNMVWQQVASVKHDVANHRLRRSISSRGCSTRITSTAQCGGARGS